MSKLWSKIILGLVTAFVIGISNVNAELTCVAQPSCAMLGYSKTNVPNCTGYIHCPFDTSYKKCVTLDHTEGKCTGYSLADCPPHAKCEPCGSYKISSCADGYKVDGDTCICATVCADRLTQKDIPLNAGPIKQSCNACGAVSDIITGWECNSGYVNISGECKQAYSGCEAAGYLSDRLANATCEDRIVYTTDGSALRCYTNCTCNEGFIEKDHECVEFIDCSAYTLKTCPENATCSTCTDNYDNTTHKFEKCNSGYKEQSGVCVCEKVCSDTFTGTIPANGTAVKEACTACGITSEIVTGFTCKDGYVKKDGNCVPKIDCSSYPLSSCPDNATCSKCTDNDGNSSYRFDNCNSGYKEQSGICVCEKVCSDTFTGTVPENATLKTETCTACGVSTTIKTGYSCNNGYSDKNGACVCSTVCENTYTGAIPENASATTEQCTACGKTTTITTGFTCNGGYNKQGNSCVCAKVCKDTYTGGIPANAKALTELCTACGETSEIVIGFTCNSGYNQSGNSCVCAKTCADTYTGSIPANATATTEQCTACGVSSTIITGYTCKSGYEGNDCHCSKVCSDTYTGSIPTNATATKETCVACGVSKSIVTGWTCNTGYMKVGGTCEKIIDCSSHTLASCPSHANCSQCTDNSGKTTYKFESCTSEYTLSGGVCVCAKTCADVVTTKPANSTFMTETCTACGVSSTIKTGWVCNNGYNRSDNSCVCAKTCADTYTGSIPANATADTEVCTACGFSSTIITGYTCKSGYEGSDCHCSKVCSDTYTGSIPTNATATKETCVACGVSKSIVTGWTCNTGYMKVGGTCEKIIDCSSHTLASCPSHANCSQCTDNSGKTTYKFESCTSEYTLSGGVCVCAKTCADVVTTKPANSTFTTEVCTACGSSTTIKTGWICNSGYEDKSGACVCKKTCADTYTGNLPDSAYYTTETCVACGISSTIKTGWACNSGYHKSGNVCLCDKTCSDTYTGTKPTNADYTTETCTACGRSTQIITGYTCKSGYEGDDCHCSKVCSDKISSKPVNSDYTYETCVACGVSKTIISGYTCKSGYEGNDCHCSKVCSDTYTGSLPSNAYYTYETCVACGNSTTIKTGWACNNGYTKQSGACVCATTCADKVSSKPANSSFTTEVCTACGVSSTIKTGWTCNSGYVESGNSCVCAKTCADTYTGSLPDNAYYTTETCTACGINTTIKTGWACNSGYHKSGNSCVCDVTCNDTYTGTKPTNASWVYGNCTACGVTTKIKTDYECYAGYEGSDCHCATTCIDKISSKPSHSDYDTVRCDACGNVSYIKTGFTCHNGYEGSDCHCATTCTDKVSSKPANSSFTTEVCTACGVSSTIKTGWKCDDGYKEQSSTCVCATTCTDKISDKPANASWVYGNCTACGVSSRIKTGFQCLSGYTGSDCHCATTCADTYTGTLPAYAHYDTETCTACGVSTTIKTGWSCNSGYVKVGNTCKKYYSSCSAAGYLSSPKSNATCSTVSVYTSSGSTMTCYSGCTCKSGYTGDPCVCATTCTDKVTSKPDNASYTYESCTACESSYSIKSGWTCDSGYVKSGNSCLCPSGTYDSKALCESNNPYSNCTIDVKCYKPTSCKSGYAKSASACGSKSGWTLGDADYYGCRRCNKKECPDVMMKVPYYGNSSGSASGSAGYGYTYRLLSSSITNNAYACGTQGSKGWTTVLTSNYSGDNACYACKPNACPTGYSAGRTSVADCGTGGAANWEFYIANNATYGEEICSKCVRKTTTCPSGYTAGLTNVSKCGSQGANGWTLKTQGNCGKCEAKECTQGQTKGYYNTIVDGVSLLYQQYFIFTENSYYSGDSKCGKFSLNKQMWCEDYKSSLINVCTSNQSGSGTVYWFGYAYEEYKERELGLSDDIFKYCSEYPTDKYCNLSDKTGYGYDLNACISVVKNNFSQYGTKYDFCSECTTDEGSNNSPYYCQDW